MHKERIELTDNGQDMVIKMCDGNPGAITALMGLITADHSIDPQSMLGILGPILSLDSYGIYGSSIYILWNDQCDRNTHKLIVLLRATQMGIFSDEVLKELAADQTRNNIITDIEWTTMVQELNDKLPSLNTNY